MKALQSLILEHQVLSSVIDALESYALDIRQGRSVEPADLAVHAGVEIAHRREPRRHRGQGEVRGIGRLELVPRQRRRYPRIRLRPHRVDRCDRLPARVLAMVHEDPLPLALQPLGGDQAGVPLLEPAREALGERVRLVVRRSARDRDLRAPRGTVRRRRTPRRRGRGRGPSCDHRRSTSRRRPAAARSGCRRRSAAGRTPASSGSRRSRRPARGNRT